VDKYPNLEDVVGAGGTEEHGRGGRTCAAASRSHWNMLTIRYIGRPERASPAEGYSEAHKVEQARIIKDVLTLAAASSKKKTSKV